MTREPVALRLAHLMHDARGGGQDGAQVGAQVGAQENLPLLIAHGLYGSARNFNSLGKRLAHDRRVVLVDMRNHGGSPWDGEMTYRAMAADLAEAVERLCGGRAIVLGHSMGGKAAMALALSRPDLVVGAVVADIAPVAYNALNGGRSHLRYIDAMRGVDLSRVARRSDADTILAEAVEEPMLRSFLLQNLVVDGEGARWRLNLDALKTSLPDLMGWPGGWPRPAFEGPALFVHGTASGYVRPEMEAEIRALFPRAEFAPLDGAGHWLHSERPEAFLAAVFTFLENRI